MRYIDEMLKEIPVEELMGVDNSYTENKILSVIPETSSEYVADTAEEMRKDAGQTDMDNLNEKDMRKKITKSGARVKSKHSVAIAAALAVVLGAGTLTTYLGAVEHVGPLASVFSTDDKQSGEAEIVSNIKTFWGTQTHDRYYSDTLGNDQAESWKALLGEEVTDLGLELYGEYVQVVFQNGNNKDTFSVSDRSNADVIYNGKYYKSPELLRRLSECRTLNSGCVISAIMTDVCAIDSHSVKDWYKTFLAENAQPVTNLGTEKIPQEMYAATFTIEDSDASVQLHTVSSSKYENANIMVDGKYYNLKNTYVLDVIRLEGHGYSAESAGEMSIIAYRGKDQNPVMMYPTAIENGSDWYTKIMNAEKSQVTEFTSTPADDVVLTAVLKNKNTNDSIIVQRSDRPEADVKINGVYYKCAVAKELFSEVVTEEFSVGKNGIVVRGSGSVVSDLKQWYKAFRQKNLAPIANVTETKNEGAPEYIANFVDNIDGENVHAVIRTTGCEYANIIIGNQYYHVDDLDAFKAIIDKANKEYEH